MLRTIRRTVLLAAAAGVSLLGLGLGQASAALPALPVALPALPATSLPIDPQAPTAALPLDTVKAPAGVLMPVNGSNPVDVATAPIDTPGVSDVDVAGLGSGTGVQLPHTNLQPNVTGSTLDGVTAPDSASVPTLDKVTDGSALNSLDATKLVPELGVLQALPHLG
ncbi:hypothetical protein GCM10029964_122760 [Kibdelosporangium lantanae]